MLNCLWNWVSHTHPTSSRSSTFSFNFTSHTRSALSTDACIPSAARPHPTCPGSEHTCRHSQLTVCRTHPRAAFIAVLLGRIRPPVDHIAGSVARHCQPERWHTRSARARVAHAYACCRRLTVPQCAPHPSPVWSCTATVYAHPLPHRRSHIHSPTGPRRPRTRAGLDPYHVHVTTGSGRVLSIELRVLDFKIRVLDFKIRAAVARAHQWQKG